MKKILAACLLLAVLPLFAKPIPSSGPERKAAISKIHGRIALVQLGLEDYKVAVVPFGCEDFRISFVEFGCQGIN